MTATRSGIPTTHAGTNFRSRLEARWAAFFDLVNWSWVYEPFDADGYIPDFLITGPAAFLVEVGPCIDNADYVAKSEKPLARAGVLRRDVAVLGVDPAAGRYRDTPDHVVAGLLLEFDGIDHLEPGRGYWGRCFECGLVGLVHGHMSFHLRPCGHHQSGSFGEPIHRDELEAAWRRAGNDVQWKSPTRAGVILDGILEPVTDDATRRARIAETLRVQSRSMRRWR